MYKGSTYLKIEICWSHTCSTFSWLCSLVTSILLGVWNKCTPLSAHPVTLFLERSQLSGSGVRSAIGTGWYKVHPVTEQVPDGAHETAIKSRTGDTIATIIKKFRIIWIINLINGYVYPKDTKVSSWVISVGYSVFQLNAFTFATSFKGATHWSAPMISLQSENFLIIPPEK